MTPTQTAHPLYLAAEHADAHYSEIIRLCTGRTRWTLTGYDLIHYPEIRDAYRAKLAADEAWLAFLRTHR